VNVCMGVYVGVCMCVYICVWVWVCVYMSLCGEGVYVCM